MRAASLSGRLRLKGTRYAKTTPTPSSHVCFSCGDYASGTNHTLPTNGYARQYSGVNTQSFQKHITSQEITQAGLQALGPTVVTLADCEGLQAHANAVRIRLQRTNQ